MSLTGRSSRPGRRTKNQVVAEFRHSGILDAARRVFAARGFEGACVEHIARLAGVAKGTVYLYYPSKQAVYRAALRQGLSEMCAELSRRVAEAGTPREKLRAFVATKLAHVEAHADFFRIYSAALGHSPRPLAYHKDFRPFHDQQMALLRGALVGSRDPEGAALAVFDVLRGVIERRLHGGVPASGAPDADGIVDLLWKGVRP